MSLVLTLTRNRAAAVPHDLCEDDIEELLIAPTLVAGKTELRPQKCICIKINSPVIGVLLLKLVSLGPNFSLFYVLAGRIYPAETSTVLAILPNLCQKLQRLRKHKVLTRGIAPQLLIVNDRADDNINSVSSNGTASIVVSLHCKT